MEFKNGDKFIVVKALHVERGNRGQLHGTEENNLIGCILITHKTHPSMYDTRQVVTVRPFCKKSKAIFLSQGSNQFRVSGRYLHDSKECLIRLHKTGIVDALREMIAD